MATKPVNRSTLSELLSDPEKMADKAEEPVACLWRRLLAALNVDLLSWNNYQEHYLKKSPVCRPKNNRDKNDKRNTLIKEFQRTRLSFKVFLKGLYFLQFDRVDIIVVARKNRKQYLAEVSIDLNTMPEQVSPENDEAMKDPVVLAVTNYLASTAGTEDEPIYADTVKRVIEAYKVINNERQN